MGISQYRLAKEIDVPPQRIGEIVKGRRAITTDNRSALVPILRPRRRLLAAGAGRPRHRGSSRSACAYAGLNSPMTAAPERLNRMPYVGLKILPGVTGFYGTMTIRPHTCPA